MSDSDSLFEFSKACMQTDPTNPSMVKSKVLRDIFADKSMIDLCRANGQVLKELDFFMNLPESDYTRIDHNNRYVLGPAVINNQIVNGQIISKAYAALDTAAQNGIPASTIATYRKQTADGLDRIYGVVPVAAAQLSKFGEGGSDIGAMVLGPGGAPFVLERKTKSVYRIQIRFKGSEIRRG